ncbi:hypothetical protein HMPREF2829_07985 [Aerococcus sp. HMSC072A12]|nr:hypothetical protein HMPREF2829_07985 [Aerococcus sp. HMSC072A12]OFR35219.1 hypothetical protein HMPREF2892_01345 [Aerococcus sp. HMSC061A03]OFT39736.1 hypothetical protein HMPREF3161_06230 [Aerococcus sp. HMSC06H08]
MLYHTDFNERPKTEREEDEFVTKLLLDEFIAESNVTTYKVLKHNYIPEETRITPRMGKKTTSTASWLMVSFPSCLHKIA